LESSDELKHCPILSEGFTSSETFTILINFRSNDNFSLSGNSSSLYNILHGGIFFFRYQKKILSHIGAMDKLPKCPILCKSAFIDRAKDAYYSLKRFTDRAKDAYYCLSAFTERAKDAYYSLSAFTD